MAETARQHDRDDSAGGGEHAAFGGELTNQRHAGRADRDAHGHLAIARAGAREQQVCQVRACNQENQRCDGQQELQRILILCPQGAHAGRRWVRREAE